jgi:cell division inhibitor SulA
MLQASSVFGISASSSHTIEATRAFNCVITEDDISASLALLKIIHQCNQKKGWTLLIAPDNVPNKAMMESCSIDSSKLLVIRKRHIVDLNYVLRSALNNGNFAAVITWTDVIEPISLEALNLPSSSTDIFCFCKNAPLETCTIDALIS